MMYVSANEKAVSLNLHRYNEAKPRDEWVLDWPGMVVLVVTAVYWTKDVTEVRLHSLPGVSAQLGYVDYTILAVIN
jgi:hypothetical protein